MALLNLDNDARVNCSLMALLVLVQYLTTTEEAGCLFSHLVGTLLTAFVQYLIASQQNALHWKRLLNISGSNEAGGHLGPGQRNWQKTNAAFYGKSSAAPEHLISPLQCKLAKGVWCHTMVFPFKSSVLQSVGPLHHTFLVF